MTPADATQTPIRLFTIGFTGKSAEEFFEALQEAGVCTLIDIRLNNVSQLAGFTKKRDLAYFLDQIAGIAYQHEVSLAPAKDFLTDYKKKQIPWSEFEQRFIALLNERKPEQAFKPDKFHNACLLCSEFEPDHCHRRLVAEHLQSQWGNMEIRHL